jgi:hypothetical protein
MGVPASRIEELTVYDNLKPGAVLRCERCGLRQARAREIQLEAGADLQASAARLGCQIGDAKLKVSATSDGLSR